MSRVVTDERAIDRVLKRGVVEVIVEQELRQMMRSGRPLRLKMGFDPSRPDIHLGHVVGLRKLRQFQDLGHQVILIVGDWTARIGDPSGQSATRQMLTEEEVLANAKTYMEQFFRIVDKERTRAVWQSEWFGTFTLADVIKLTSKFTVAQFLAREDFRKRFQEEKPIAITEFLYPLLQGYDSVMVQSDVEFGGTDQKFNMLVGRELQEMLGQQRQQVVTMPLLVGTDGVKKMSKSLGNYIAVTDPPDDMYGKVMSLPDALLLPYLELLTDVPDDELAQAKADLEAQRVNPMSLKKRLAADIVRQFHGPDEARAAEERFARVFQQREAPPDMPVYTAASATVDLLDALTKTGLASSKSEVRRLLAQEAIEIAGAKVKTESIAVSGETVVKVGKRRFLRIVLGR